MYEQYAHLYDRLPLSGTGIAMGGILLLLHLIALLCPAGVCSAMNKTHLRPQWGVMLMCIDFIWIALLLVRADWNPLCMPLFFFELFRMPLLLACPVVCWVLCTQSKEHLFARALGLFLLLMAIVPLSAAFLKDPITRLLIPIWWYPVLTVAMVWIVKPYLLRDWAAWISARPRLFKVAAWAGLLYAAALLICAICFW